MASLTSPLSSTHQRFLQRLLASHVLTDEAATDLWDNLNGQEEGDNSLPLSEINKQLTAGFGLEIGTIKLHSVKYHTIINQHGDENKDIRDSMTEFNPHERAYIRAVLEKIVVASTSNDDDDDEDGGVTRMDLINLRTSITKPYTMPTIEQVTQVLDKLVDEGWLLVVASGAGGGGDRRKSRMSEAYELGPRTYLELSEFLVDVGYPKDGLPQFIYHRA
jgi:hypothetical protein